MQRYRTVLAPEITARILGEEARPEHRPGPPVAPHLHRGHEVEPQARQVDEVVTRERLGTQMRVDEPNAAKATRGGAQTPDVGKHQLRSVADDHRLDLPRTVH